MDEKWIIKQLAAQIDHLKFPFQLANAFIYSWECDYWTMTPGGECREFEIKISRADFLNDAKKSKHQEGGGANYFYYVCPKDMIKKEELDKRYGLVYIWDTGYIEIVKTPRRLHAESFKQWAMLANKIYGRFHLLWKEKWMAKEITRDEYFDGLNLKLEEFESISNQLPKEAITELK